MKNFFLWASDRAVLVLGFCAAVFFALSWGQDGISQDSATYAVIARNMAENGTWLTPHYTQFVWASLHPPLVMWGQGLIFLILEPNDSTARLFGALCSIGSILTVYFIGKLVADKSFGFLSALILLFTYNFIKIGNSTLLDVPLTFFVSLALLGFLHNWKTGPNIKYSALTGLALAGAWLTKGVVAAPVFIAIAVAVLIWQRPWLKQKEFWILPITALSVMEFHIIFDFFLGEKRMVLHYFNTPLIRNFFGSESLAGHNWLGFIAKFVTLYLPFVVLIPFGLYSIIRNRLCLLYPVLITLALYIFFYSASPVVHYHYFPPLYALSSLVVAWPLMFLMRKSNARYLAGSFLILWVITALVLKSYGVKIEHIRTQEIYSLNEEMTKLLSHTTSRNGLTIDENYEYNWVAKAAWYWRSDLENVTTLSEALPLLKSPQFDYLLIDKKNITLMDSLNLIYANEVELILENEKVGVFVERGLTLK